MKKVLMIAHQFPPMGGSGVQRTTKFVKYLRNFNWEPVVFTREVKNMPLKDSTLLKDIPQDVSIIRTSPWDFSELPTVFGLGGKLFHRKFLIPDGERLWQLFGRNRAVQAVKTHKADLIYTTSAPYSDHLMGLYLKRRFPATPWIADFRDEWTNNPYILDNPHNKLRTALEKRMEHNVLTHADYIITNTPIMLQNFVNMYPFSRDKFFVIPNGYDEEDFKDLPSITPSNEKFTITYTGLMYGRRKPDVFFEALRQLASNGQVARDRIQVNLIGNFKVDYMNSLISDFKLEDIVRLSPYMPHKQCIVELMKSDALLLIEGNGPGAEAFFTGKVFEYMNTGRPILAIIPAKGAAAQLVESTATGLVSDCSDINKTKMNLLGLYSDWLNKQSNFSPIWENIRKYERKVLTRELANIFDKAVNDKKN